MNFQRYGNSLGQSERNRARWTQNLPFKIKDARKEPVEYLWFIGDYASFDARIQEITRTTANLLNIAGVDFGILYEGERNSGNDVRRMGEEGLYEMLVEKNVAVLGKSKFEKILTTDPHTFNTVKNEYPKYGASYPIMHYSQLLLQSLRNGKLNIKNGSRQRVTYHDPCFLGRYNGIYDEPRDLMRTIGYELIEMPRNRKNSHCCGAGGGRIWMEDKPGIQERPSESRVKEAASLQGVEILAASCPKDIVMFQDAVKTTKNDGKIIVKDIAELVWESMDESRKEE
jgi:Fe-S oxidoreductase